MKTGKTPGTVVLNLMDGRESIFELPPDEAVLAAFQAFDEMEYAAPNRLNPSTHPDLKEYRLGYSCGDWIAYRDESILGYI